MTTEAIVKRLIKDLEKIKITQSGCFMHSLRKESLSIGKKFCNYCYINKFCNKDRKSFIFENRFDPEILRRGLIRKFPLAYLKLKENKKS